MFHMECNIAFNVFSTIFLWIGSLGVSLDEPSVLSILNAYLMTEVKNNKRLHFANLFYYFMQQKERYDNI